MAVFSSNKCLQEKSSGNTADTAEDDILMMDTKKNAYGDLVCAIAFTAVTPIDGWKALMTCQQVQQQYEYDTDTNVDTDVDTNDCSDRIFGLCQTAILSVIFCAIYGGLNWISYLHHFRKYSFFAFLSGLWLCAFNNLQQWPYAGECVITYQFHGILVGCLSNGSLSFQEQIIRMALMFGVASYVSIKSPFSVYNEDVLPLLGGPILLSIAALAVTRININWNSIIFEPNWNALTVQGSRYVLAGIYMYHTAVGLLSIHTNEDNERPAQEILIAIVKAAFIACVGVGATGAFQNEIDLNERLEVHVQNRTKVIQEKNDKLYMIELALRQSETAIAITDSDLCIIWLNAACKEISTSDSAATKGKKDIRQHQQLGSELLLGKLIVETLSLDTILDEKKLTRAFSSRRREDEVCINEMVFHLEVSPYEYALDDKSLSSREKDTRMNQISKKSNNKGNNDNNRYLVVFKNITAKRAMEVAKETAQKEAMLAKAMEDSMVTLTHELRTPMQGIMGVTGMLLLQQNKTKEEQQTDTVLVESLKLIMASSGLLLNLINNLLDVKKVNSEMMEEFPLSLVIARSAIKDTIDFCQPLASISGVAVVTDYGESKINDYMVVSNALRLQQVLINLVSNAIKYTDEESEICIRIRPTDMADVEHMMDHALASSRDNNSTDNIPNKGMFLSNSPVLYFSISDCGPGIANHQVDRLFRRFARLDCKPTRVLGGNTAVGQPSGTGLGLNLCQLFLQRMNGEIWATNNSDGRGSTFSFFLPLAIDNKPTRVDSRITTPVGISKRCKSFEDLSLTTSQLKILLVDDVLINRKVIGRMIKLVGVSDIVTVDSGQNALIELSKNGPYDLVISDLQMPGMSGIQLCEAIMTNTNHSLCRLPVVVGLTADTSGKVTESCRASGMSTVLHKPISVSEIGEFLGKNVELLEPGVWHTQSVEVVAAQ